MTTQVADAARSVIAPLQRIGRSPIVYGHGAANSPLELLGAVLPTIRPTLTPIAERDGHPIGCYEHAQDWANDADLDAALAMLTTLRTLHGAGPGKAAGVGSSMGAATMLRLALVYPELFACIVLLIGALDIPTLAENDESGARAPIYSAWGETYPNPLPADADLLSFELTIPALVYSASNDPFSVNVPTWAAAQPMVEFHDLGPVGHDPATADAARIRSFIQEHTR